MKLDVKIQLLKFCAQVFNSIFLLLGLSVTGFAVWILFDRGSLQTVLSSVELRTVGAGLLLIGGLVLLVSVIGCVGADAENRFLLLVYLSFLVVLVLGQLFVTLLLLVNRDKIERSLDQTVDQIIVLYGENSQDRLMDNIQKFGQCCGRTGPADWLKNSYIQSLNLTSPDILPCSCFSSYRPSLNSPWCSELLDFTTDPLYGQGNSSYEQGCNEQISDWLHENALTIIGMDVGLMLIQGDSEHDPMKKFCLRCRTRLFYVNARTLQVVQFVIMVYLYRAIIRKAALKTTTSLSVSDHAHMDHAYLDHAPEDDLDYAAQNYGYIDPDDGYMDPAYPAHYHDYPNHVDPTHLAYHHDNQNYT